MFSLCASVLKFRNYPFSVENKKFSLKLLNRPVACKELGMQLEMIIAREVTCNYL